MSLRETLAIVIEGVDFPLLNQSFELSTVDVAVEGTLAAEGKFLGNGSITSYNKQFPKGTFACEVLAAFRTQPHLSRVICLYDLGDTPLKKFDAAYATAFLVDAGRATAARIEDDYQPATNIRVLAFVPTSSEYTLRAVASCAVADAGCC